ncbi:MAG: hypothetical protein EOP53_17060 [Sphingobacteriales bacterium]|nr:MAG: hypothetical protein EOP53_17060 [Sphingobacteriales bacterium]
MKKQILGLAKMAMGGMFVIFSLSSCEKLTPETLDFDMDNVSYTFTLPAADSTGQMVISTNKMVINIDSVMLSKNIDNYDAESLTLKSADLSTSTPGANFNSFESASAYIQNNAQPETKIADQNAVPKNAQKVDLNVNKKINLVEFVKEKPTTFIIKGNVIEPLKNPMTITMNASYKLKLKKK